MPREIWFPQYSCVEYDLAMLFYLNAHHLPTLQTEMVSRVISRLSLSNAVGYDDGETTGFVHVELEGMRGQLSLKPESGVVGCRLVEGTVVFRSIPEPRPNWNKAVTIIHGPEFWNLI